VAVCLVSFLGLAARTSLFASVCAGSRSQEMRQSIVKRLLLALANQLRRNSITCRTTSSAARPFSPSENVTADCLLFRCPVELASHLLAGTAHDRLT